MAEGKSPARALSQPPGGTEPSRKSALHLDKPCPDEGPSPRQYDLEARGTFLRQPQKETGHLGHANVHWRLFLGVLEAVVESPHWWLSRRGKHRPTKCWSLGPTRKTSAWRELLRWSPGPHPESRVGHRNPSAVCAEPARGNVTERPPAGPVDPPLGDPVARCVGPAWDQGPVTVTCWMSSLGP